MQIVMQPEIFQSMIDEIKDYTASNKELVKKMVGSMNNNSLKVDKLLEQNRTMINLLADLIKSNNIFSDKYKNQKKEEAHDDEKEY